MNSSKVFADIDELCDDINKNYGNSIFRDAVSDYRLSDTEKVTVKGTLNTVVKYLESKYYGKNLTNSPRLKSGDSAIINHIVYSLTKELKKSKKHFAP